MLSLLPGVKRFFPDPNTKCDVEDQLRQGGAKGSRTQVELSDRVSVIKEEGSDAETEREREEKGEMTGKIGGRDILKVTTGEERYGEDQVKDKGDKRKEA